MHTGKINIGNKPAAVSLAKKMAQEGIQFIFQSFSDFPWEDRNVYGLWLAQTHFYTRHITRSLAYAAAKCNIDDQPLHKSFLQGILEEQDHDLIALKDLNDLGFEITDFDELPETSAYYQTMRYAIDRDGPAALLGYALPLEGVAANEMGEILTYLTDTYKGKAIKFLRVHCKHDVSHYAEALGQLESLRLNQLQAVIKNIQFSAKLYASMVCRVKAEAFASARNKRKSA